MQTSPPTQPRDPPPDDDPVTTPVHLERDTRADRLEIVDDENGHILACGFASPEAARRWVHNHNRISGWHQLQLDDA
jgi:hypothetical protein